MEAKTILWVDDDEGLVAPHKPWLKLYNYEVENVRTVKDAKSWIGNRAKKKRLALVIIDLHIRDDADPRNYDGGYELARWLRSDHPDVCFIGTSYESSPAVQEFRGIARGFIPKRELDVPGRIKRAIRHAMTKRNEDLSDLQTFIVHGSDNELKLEVKNFLQNGLKLPEPKILQEMSSEGMTIIEKFERHAGDIDVAFVLLSPEDEVRPAAHGANSATSSASYSQSRPNVLFEMGYFMALMGRRSGRVVLLYKDGCQINSDISGVLRIDVTRGVASAEREIRCALQDVLGR